MSNFSNSPTRWRTSILFSAASGSSSHSVTTIIGIGGAAGSSLAPVIVMTARVVEDLAILGAEGGPSAITSDPGSGTAAKGPSSTGDSRERMLRRGVVVARGLVVRGGGGGMVLSFKGSTKRGSTSSMCSPAGSRKAMLWVSAWRLLDKKKREE